MQPGGPEQIADAFATHLRRAVLRGCGLGLGLSFLVACQSPIAPDSHRLPPPDTSLDPTRLRVGALLYACGAWSLPAAAGRDSLLVVDVKFSTYGQRPVDDPRWNAPSDAERRIVTRAGGEVLFAYPWPGVRARIAARNIPALAVGDTVAVYSVPDSRRYDWSYAVFFVRNAAITTRPTAIDSLIEAAGGRITLRWPPAALATELPVQSVAHLRARPDVRLVAPNGIFCPR